jgi:hypothetical protein
LLHGGFLPVQRQRQHLLATPGSLGSGDDPVLFVDVPTGDQGAKKQDYQPKHHMTPPNAQPVSDILKSPLNYVPDTSELDFHLTV